MDHEIETEREEKPPDSPFCQHFLIELKEIKEYVQDLSNIGKIRPNKSTYGGPLLLVKEK